MYRRTLLLLFALLFGRAAFAQSGAILSFKETTHDFGQVPLDSPLHYSFEFTNSGNAMLIITGIEPSCHCVSVNWRRGPVMPGEKGKIDITYAAPLDEGRFDRGLLIASNASNIDPSLMRYELRVRGEGVKAQPPAGTSRTKRRVHGAGARHL